MKTLPSKPSELVKLAIIDLKAIEATPGYLIDMGSWHSGHAPGSSGDKCWVCLAGAVMANSLGVKPSMSVKPWDPIFGSDVTLEGKLAALDSFRNGNIYHGITLMCPEFDDYHSAHALLEKMGMSANIFVPEYEEDREEFYQGMEKVIKILKEHAL